MATGAVDTVTIPDLPPDLVSLLRTRLMEAGEVTMALSTVNSLALMRGIRGILGVRWLSLELATPESVRLLTSIDPTAMDSLLAAMVAAHAAEVQRRGGSDEAKMFSQLREGRHAGQSGGRWLEAAATPDGTAGLRMCAARLTATLPFGWLQPVRPMALTDAAMSNLLSTCKGIFPFVHDTTAGDYTAMDLGRVAWMMALLLGKVVAAPLGALSFNTLMHMQGAATKRAWKQMGIDAQTFRSLEWRLRDAVAGAATKERLPMPSWAPSESSMVWVQVAVHICEYSQTLADLGSANIQQVLKTPPAAKEVDLIVERITELMNGGSTDGRCHMALVVETLLEARGLNYKSPPSNLYEDSCRTHANHMVKLVRFGLSPKAMWWLNGNIVEMLMGLQRVRGLVAAENERIASLLLSIDSASACGMCHAEATVAAAHHPCISSGSDLGMPQQVISQHEGEMVVTSRPLRTAHVRAKGPPPKETLKYKLMAKTIKCPDCGSRYRRSNRSYHVASQKHLNAVAAAIHGSGQKARPHQCGLGSNRHPAKRGRHG